MSTQETEYASTLGARIRKARKESGKTQAELASRAGIAKDTLSRYERGGMVPSAEMIIGLASALGVPATWLLVGSEEYREQWPEHSAEDSTGKRPIHANEGACTALVGSEIGVVARAVFTTVGLWNILSLIKTDQEKNGTFPKELSPHFELVQDYLFEAAIPFSTDVAFLGDGDFLIQAPRQEELR